MFFNTKSVGVRRLSLILGLISGFFFIGKYHTPIVGNDKLWVNLADMGLLFAVGFFATWLEPISKQVLL
jgi:hypothetical protein